MRAETPEKIGGRGVRQVAQAAALAPGASSPATTTPQAKRVAFPQATNLAAPPVVMNESQTAAFLGVSSRTLLKLRHEPWFPMPLNLGPRATRWLRDELIEALAKQAPRGGVQPQPVQLVSTQSERTA